MDRQRVFGRVPVTRRRQAGADNHGQQAEESRENIVAERLQQRLEPARVMRLFAREHFADEDIDANEAADG